jgi:hypothetical protein
VTQLSRRKTTVWSAAGERERTLRSKLARLGVAAGTLTLLALGLLGGGAQASTSSSCNPSGRAICISITDVDDVSHSTTTVERYTSYTIEVSNGGGSTLTNGSLVAALTDVVGGVGQPATARVVSAPDRCTLLSATSFTCPLPNLAAGAAAPAISFFAATSTDAAASATRLTARATFKEKASDKGTADPQADSFAWFEDTILEAEPDASRSIVFSGGSTVLATLPGHRGQSSVFGVPVGTGFAGSQLATLDEFSSGESGYFCPAGFSCFGQSVATSAPDIFSVGNLANLVTTLDLALLPNGVTEKSLRVHHDDASFTTRCSGDLFTAPSASEVPCRRVVIDRRAEIVTIDIWDNHQGDWGFS